MAEREKSLPPALASEPQLDAFTAPYLSAFKRLHSSRIIGPNGQPSGIGMPALLAYCQLYNYTQMQDRVDLVFYVQACDNTWLGEMSKRKVKSGPAIQQPARRR